MTVPKEYNIIDGIIGLGPDIMLEILTETINIIDFQQLIVTQLFPINSPCLEDLIYDRDIYIHAKENDNYTTIVFNPIIIKGIAKIQILNISKLQGIGIADGHIHYDRNQCPSDAGFNNILCFFHTGDLVHVGDFNAWNTPFNSGDSVAMELNMDSNPRSITFFVNNVEQINCIINIPEAVRFWAYFLQPSSSFQVIKFEYLSQPTAKHIRSKNSYIILTIFPASEMFCGKKNEQSPVCSIVFRVINLLYIIVGIVLLAVGIYFTIALDELLLIAIGLVILGVIVILVAIFGCCGAGYESKYDDEFCGTLLLLTLFFVISLAAGVFLILIGYICFTAPDLIEGTVKTQVDSYQKVVDKTGHKWSDSLDSALRSMNVIGIISIVTGVFVLIGWLFSVYLIGIRTFLKLSVTFGSIVLTLLGIFIFLVSGSVSKRDTGFIILVSFVVGAFFILFGLLGLILSCTYTRSNGKNNGVMVCFGVALVVLTVLMLAATIFTFIYSWTLSDKVEDRRRWQENQVKEEIQGPTIPTVNYKVNQIMDLINEGEEVDEEDEKQKLKFGSYESFVDSLRKECEIDKILGLVTNDNQEEFPKESNIVNAEGDDEGEVKELTLADSPCANLIWSVLNYSCEGDTKSELNKIQLCTLKLYEDRDQTEENKTMQMYINYGKYDDDTQIQVGDTCKCLDLNLIKTRAGRQGVESLFYIVGLSTAAFGVGILDVAGIFFFALLVLCCYLSLAALVLGCTKKRRYYRY
ncbi:MAG: hypothetical protein EZS28_008329 [Streblomastix strix]|uniref:Uncharacterized protein n=1 Tax=Streblomastix strix TaxID=222440 RepID=A0A5J4WNE6_9EUKA|nr:MAG: hypothetical protein EZS28_008329 [Streblomastix strix]